MGNGQDVLMPWLNDWLLRRDKPHQSYGVQVEVAKREHPVPSGPKEMSVSQNLFLLEAGCDAALNGNLSPQLDGDLIVRLTRERDELGLWGSECTSPIYHHFIITGLSAIYHNTNNATLKDLIEQNLGSFFWYVLKMGLANSKHGLIGMRGTGHDFGDTGFPDLHFVCQYFTSGRPKDQTRLSAWKPYLKDSGWVSAGLPGGRSYDLYKKVFEYAVDDGWNPWRLRSKLTFLREGGSEVGHFYEKGINGNTPAMIGYVHPSDYALPGGYLPVNSTIRVRQKHDNSAGGYIVDGKSIFLTYNGLYTSLTGGTNSTQARTYFNPYLGSVDALTSSLDGVTGWVKVHPSASVPVDAPPPTVDPPVTRPRKKKSPWWMFWK